MSIDDYWHFYWCLFKSIHVSMSLDVYWHLLKSLLTSPLTFLSTSLLTSLLTSIASRWHRWPFFNFLIKRAHMSVLFSSNKFWSFHVKLSGWWNDDHKSVLFWHFYIQSWLNDNIQRQHPSIWRVWNHPTDCFHIQHLFQQMYQSWHQINSQWKERQSFWCPTLHLAKTKGHWHVLISD